VILMIFVIYCLNLDFIKIFKIGRIVCAGKPPLFGRGCASSGLFWRAVPAGKAKMPLFGRGCASSGLFWQAAPAGKAKMQVEPAWIGRTR
jgi:hypothetical protein